MKTTIVFDEDTSELIRQLEGQTGLNASQQVKRLISGHLVELHELVAFLDANPPGAALNDAAVNLLVSYGPESITDGIKRLNPAHDSLGAKFARSIDALSGHTEVVI